MENVGRIEAIDGEVTITRADGTTVQAESGTEVFEGDVVVTDSGESVSIIFEDQSIFSMGESGEMVIDEMIYDPDDQTGSMNIDIAHGVATFVSGFIAKTDPDAMSLTTPVATIGIRGTQVGVSVEPNGETKAALMVETDGFIGEIVVQNEHGVQVINQPNYSTTIMPGFRPSDPVELTLDLIEDRFGLSKILTEDAVGVLDEDIPELEEAHEDSLEVERNSEFKGEFEQEGSTHQIEVDAQNGKFVLNPDGTYTYVPDEGFVGQDSVTITYMNEFGEWVTETIYFNVVEELSSDLDAEGLDDFETAAGGPRGFDEDFVNVVDDADDISPISKLRPIEGPSNEISPLRSITDAPDRLYGSESENRENNPVQPLPGIPENEGSNGDSSTLPPVPTPGDDGGGDPEPPQEPVPISTNTETITREIVTVSDPIYDDEISYNDVHVDDTITTTQVTTHNATTTTTTEIVEVYVTTIEFDDGTVQVSEADPVVIDTIETEETIQVAEPIEEIYSVTTIELVETQTTRIENENIVPTEEFIEETTDNITETDLVTTNTKTWDEITVTSTQEIYTTTFSDGRTETQEFDPDVTSTSEPKEEITTETEWYSTATTEDVVTIETVHFEPIVEFTNETVEEPYEDPETGKEYLQVTRITTTTTQNDSSIITTVTPTTTTEYATGETTVEEGEPVQTADPQETETTVETESNWLSRSITEDVVTTETIQSDPIETITYEDFEEIVEDIETGDEYVQITRVYTTETVYEETVVTTTTPTTTTEYADGEITVLTEEPVITESEPTLTDPIFTESEPEIISYEPVDDDDDDKGHGNDPDGHDSDNPGHGGEGGEGGEGRPDHSYENNGWGNGDQDAPGNSGPHNQAENQIGVNEEGFLIIEGMFAEDPELTLPGEDTQSEPSEPKIHGKKGKGKKKDDDRDYDENASYQTTSDDTPGPVIDDF